MEQMEEIRIPELNTGKAPKGKWKLAAVIAAVCVVVSAVFGVMAVKIFNREDKTLINGLHNLIEEVKERQTQWQEAGAASVDGLGALKTTTTFNLSGDELPVTLGIDTELLKDNAARRLQASAALSVMNNELAAVDIYGEDDTLTLSLPDIWKQNLAFRTDEIARQYNNSLLAEKFGSIDEIELSLELFPEKKEFLWKDAIEEWQGTIDGISSRKKQAADGELPEVVIEKLEEPAEIVIAERDNRQYQCSQYRITIPKERIDDTAAYGSVEKETVEMEVARDVRLLISLDENDRIVQISFEEPVKISILSEEYEMNTQLSGYVCFAGEARSIDDMIVNLQMEFTPDTELLNESAHLILGESYNMQEEKVKMQAEIEVLYNENDTCVTTNFNRLTILVEGLDEMGEIKLTGTITAEPLREKIEPPKGDTIWIFEMNEAEYADLEKQLQRKLLRFVLMSSFMEW